MSTPSSNGANGNSWLRFRNRTVAFWTGLVFVFFLALLPRMIYPVSRPMQWYDRSVNFWDALLAGDLGGTYQQYHPGVTTMWVAGLGLRVYAVAHGWSGDELSNPPPSPLGVEDNYPVGAGVVALSIVIAACIGLAQPGIRPKQKPSITDRKIITGETPPRSTDKSLRMNFGRIISPPLSDK